ncbi:MAG: hypothetical protein IH945_13075 [Armatimonadetes bacterium]|nr:hypothetical protein [Armatimonadota bacterium]
MKVLLREDNLMWSVRVKNGLVALGHEPVKEETEAELAIVSLSARAFDPFETVAKLKEKGLRVIGHVGHKEKDLWKRGEEAGCDQVVSNGSLANRLEAVLAGLPVKCPTPTEEEE